MASSQLTGAGAISDKYEVVCTIGHGSFGVISKVTRKTDNQVLCRKEIHYAKMQQKERDQLQTEVSILKSLRHPNIVSYFETVHIPTTQDLHLYMEYCGGGDLGKVIRDLSAKKQTASESYVWTIVSQLLSALYRCHYGMDAPQVPTDILEKPREMGLRSKSSTTILHRDLKPENIFLSDHNNVKLGDFGLSKQIQGGGFANTYVGTPYYMSPEICNGERYTLKSDIWSMGCIIYELCTTRPPFDARSALELASKIRRGTFEPIGADYSRALRELVNSCLQVDPRKRPSTHDLLAEPMVRMMRKDACINEKESKLHSREELLEQTRIEAEKMLVRLTEDRQKLEVEKQNMELEINERLRREWEVRANLKIKEMVDAQNEVERRRLHQQWEEEFPRRVAVEVERRMQEYVATQQVPHHEPDAHQTRSTSPVSAPVTSSFEMTTDDCTTDLSSLSMSESPFKAVPSARAKRASRTPFTRAKAQTAVDSPMDVHMASPSPVTSLSLSPRRRGVKNPIADGSLNMFAADRAQRWQPTTMSDIASDADDMDEFGGFSDSENETMPLPSPTLIRANDPFKAARTNSKRPSLGRQQTMPVNSGMEFHHKVPSLFKINVAQTKGVAEPSRRTSPTRERRGSGLRTARTDGDMFRDAVERNAHKRNGVGRTLGELREEQVHGRAQQTIVPQQPLVLTPKDGNLPFGRGKENEAPKYNKLAATTVTVIGLQEPAVWNPDEVDEMPSPFLVKTRGRGILPTR